MDQTKIELYVDDKHSEINSNVQYLHLTHVQSLDNASCTEIEVGELKAGDLLFAGYDTDIG